MDRTSPYRHAHRSRWLKAVFAGSLLALSLAGCGGGGDSGGSTADGQTMSLEQRGQVTGDVAAKYEEILAGHADRPFDELKRYMDTLPAFTETGVEDGAVWGRFTDGRYFVFSDEWASVPAQQGPALRRSTSPAQDSQRPQPELPPQLQLRGPARLQASLDAASKPELPRSNKAVLLGLDDPSDEAFAYGKGTIQRLSDALRARGWAVNEALPADSGGGSLTVEALKSVSGAGVVYLNTHTAVFGPHFWQGLQSFSIMTDTKATDGNEILYKADLDDHSLIYHRKRDVNDPRGMPRYAATPVFIRKYLQLAENSLVVLMSCNAGTDRGTGVVQALLASHAGTIIAWDGFANARGFATVETLFDRMAGTNQTIPFFEGGELKPPAVPNRAFSFADVWNFLEAKGMLVQQGADAKHPTAHIRKFGDGFIALGPVLQEFVMIGDRIYAYGTFGSTPGKMTIGGVQVMPVWSNETIQAVVADDAHGEVALSVDKLKGNPRVLGSWRGQIEYKNISTDNQCNVPLTDAITINAHLRADMHAVRELVDGPLLNNSNATVFWAAPDTLASWNSSGSCVVGSSIVERWSGSGTYGVVSPPDVMGAQLAGRIDAVDRRFQISHTPGLTPLKTVDTSAGSSSAILIINQELQGFVNNGPDYSHLMPAGTFIALDSSMNVISNQQELASPDGKKKLQIKWGSFTVTPAFDDRVGR